MGIAQSSHVCVHFNMSVLPSQISNSENRSGTHYRGFQRLALRINKGALSNAFLNISFIFFYIFSIE